MGTEYDPMIIETVDHPDEENNNDRLNKNQDAKLIKSRYKIERDFIQAIQNGNKETA
ncbi:hypothetical protein [Oceanobacillus alkalisoli]|uniref:hypothetical protein n=1 Tax=Oceanobacillus alkalisoli TaxID=2925113 RepID=UPI001F1213D6|nr:hypothetical protein [Oceanobacillus alkalisoli]MCF3944129.1 hypothetical protein [Oceanobacillus alkalisoli]